MTISDEKLNSPPLFFVGQIHEDAPIEGTPR